VRIGPRRRGAGGRTVPSDIIREVTQRALLHTTTRERIEKLDVWDVAALLDTAQRCVVGDVSRGALLETGLGEWVCVGGEGRGWGLGTCARACFGEVVGVGDRVLRTRGDALPCIAIHVGDVGANIPGAGTDAGTSHRVPPGRVASSRADLIGEICKHVWTFRALVGVDALVGRRVSNRVRVAGSSYYALLSLVVCVSSRRADSHTQSHRGISEKSRRALLQALP
jgi:hypothetical protein